jgi:hypothetical protein
MMLEGMKDNCQNYQNTKQQKKNKLSHTKIILK